MNLLEERLPKALYRRADHLALCQRIAERRDREPARKRSRLGSANRRRNISSLSPKERDEDDDREQRARVRNWTRLGTRTTGLRNKPEGDDRFRSSPLLPREGDQELHTDGERHADRRVRKPTAGVGRREGEQDGVTAATLGAARDRRFSIPHLFSPRITALRPGAEPV